MELIAKATCCCTPDLKLCGCSLLLIRSLHLVSCYHYWSHFVFAEEGLSHERPHSSFGFPAHHTDGDCRDASRHS